MNRWYGHMLRGLAVCCSVCVIIRLSSFAIPVLFCQEERRGTERGRGRLEPVLSKAKRDRGQTRVPDERSLTPRRSRVRPLPRPPYLSIDDLARLEGRPLTEQEANLAIDRARWFRNCSTICPQYPQVIQTPVCASTARSTRRASSSRASPSRQRECPVVPPPPGLQFRDARVPLGQLVQQPRHVALGVRVM
jgi:hypothetical protein